ncbi:MAG: hypothetical protein KDI48_13170, partial [Xanthomonadales bacterium]|nr:hypothetical protein [Xanthomonadales bacterium]
MRAIHLVLLLCVCLCHSLAAQDRALRVRTIASGFNGSGGVNILPGGEVLVADFGSSINSADGEHILRFGVDGVPQVLASGLSGASGNAWDEQGRLIQSNIRAGAVVRIDTDGDGFTTLGTGITGPIGVAVKASGEIFVAACGSNQIMRVPANGGVATVFASSSLLNCPNGLTVDDQGNLYTVNFRGGGMLRIDAAGQVSFFANIPGGGNGHLTFGNDRFYVSSRSGNAVYVVSRSGEVSWLAGQGEPGRDDGPPETARFIKPNGIALSADGRTLYVNDEVNNGRVTLHPNALRAIDLDLDESGVPINSGMRGSWYDPATAGQGLLIDLVAGRNELFGAWYNFIARDETTDPSGNDQRWYSVQGEYQGHRAEL